jgi:hypothetical protein
LGKKLRTTPKIFEIVLKKIDLVSNYSGKNHLDGRVGAVEQLSFIPTQPQLKAILPIP